MASTTHRIGPNFRDTILKGSSIRLSDIASRTTADYSEVITGAGAPSGAYGRAAGTTLVYLRTDASASTDAIYVTANGGTNWAAIGGSGVGDALLADLASVANAKGASLIGIEDVATQLTATTVEGALTEIVDTAQALALTVLTAGDDRLCQAVIAVADVGAGGTDSALTLTLTQLDGTPVTSAREVLIVATMASYAPWVNEPGVGSVTFGSATVGTIVASNLGYAQVRTTADGAFACSASNADDETVNFVVISAKAISALSYQTTVIGCVPDSATWTA